MKGIYISFLICTTFFAQQTFAEMYKCEGKDGKPVYSDKKCSEKAESLEVNKKTGQLETKQIQAISQACYQLTDKKDNVTEISSFWTYQAR